MPFCRCFLCKPFRQVFCGLHCRGFSMGSTARAFSCTFLEGQFSCTLSQELFPRALSQGLFLCALSQGFFAWGFSREHVPRALLPAFSMRSFTGKAPSFFCRFLLSALFHIDSFRALFRRGPLLALFCMGLSCDFLAETVSVRSVTGVFPRLFESVFSVHTFAWVFSMRSIAGTVRVRSCGGTLPRVFSVGFFRALPRKAFSRAQF